MMEDIKLKQLTEHIDKNFLPNYLSMISKKSFNTGYDDVVKIIKKDTKQFKKIPDLLEQYRKRSNLNEEEIRKALQIADFGSFKKNDNFTKDKIIPLIVLFQLTKDEAEELLSVTGIYVDKNIYLNDCVFDYYINNFVKYNIPMNNFDEYNNYCIYAGEYAVNKLKSLVNQYRG